LPHEENLVGAGAELCGVDDLVSGFQFVDISEVIDQASIVTGKNVSVVPPPFGSPASYLPGTGTALTPSSSAWSSPTTPSTTASAGSASSGTVYYPPAEAAADGTADITVSTGSTSTPFTLPDNLFYADGSLGTLKIPKLDLSVKVYENESLESLAKGVGHFKSTSCWDGNVGLASVDIVPFCGTAADHNDRVN